jgi:hypothetical protein
VAVFISYFVELFTRLEINVQREIICGENHDDVKILLRISKFR